jgi:hypothetical protein
MRYVRTALLVLCLGLMSCDARTGGSFGDLLAGLGGGNGQQTAQDGAGDSLTVGDVTQDQATDGSAGQALPAAGAINVQVLNLGDKSVDVTLRFLFDDVVVHLSLLRVAGRTSTFVIGPELADRLLAGGVDEDGDPLPEGDFRYGVDFDDGTTVVVQFGEGTPLPPPDGDGGHDTPGVNDPPTLTMTEPAADVAVPLGGIVTFAWQDSDPDDNALVELAMRRIDGASPGALIQMVPLLAEDPDGPNDRLRVVMQGLTPGVYEVVGTIRDEETSAQSVAPGRVTVFEHPGNAAPTLDILKPSTSVVVYLGEALAVAWTDEDDGAAMITFYLDPNEVDFDGGEIQISPPLAEDPDGAGNDSGWFGIIGVPPGEYFLMGVIDDGELIGTARAPGRVIVQARTSSSPSSTIECSHDADCEDGDPCTVDSCDVESGECHHQPVDCNSNGTGDCEEVASSSAVDLNTNGIPDDCDCSLVEASSPSPADGARGVAPFVVLTWSGDALPVTSSLDEFCAPTYDVYLGPNSEELELICEGISEPSCDAGKLFPCLLGTPCPGYHWQVVAVTPAGETVGPIWSFWVGAFDLP